MDFCALVLLFSIFKAQMFTHFFDKIIVFCIVADGPPNAIDSDFESALVGRLTEVVDNTEVFRVKVHIIDSHGEEAKVVSTIIFFLVA